MRRTLITIAASSLVTAVLLVGGGFFLGRHLIASAFAAGPTPSVVAAQLPPEIKGVVQLDPAARFDHFLGGQMRFADVNNATHTVSVTPGTVQAVTSDSLTLKPNDSTVGATKSFRPTTDTHIRQHGKGWNGGQDQAQLSTGDRVVVVTMDGDQARAVIVGGPEGFGLGRHSGIR